MALPALTPTVPPICLPWCMRPLSVPEYRISEQNRSEPHKAESACSDSHVFERHGGLHTDYWGLEETADAYRRDDCEENLLHARKWIRVLKVLTPGITFCLPNRVAAQSNHKTETNGHDDPSKPQCGPPRPGPRNDLATDNSEYRSH